MEKGAFIKSIEDVPDDWEILLNINGVHCEVTMVIDYNTKVVEIERKD